MSFGIIIFIKLPDDDSVAVTGLSVGVGCGKGLPAAVGLPQDLPLEVLLAIQPTTELTLAYTPGKVCPGKIHELTFKIKLYLPTFKS